MISVYRKDWHYKFNGTTATLTNIETGCGISLIKEDIDGCNKSNHYIDRLIVKRENVDAAIEFYNFIEGL